MIINDKIAYYVEYHDIEIGATQRNEKKYAV